MTRIPSGPDLIFAICGEPGAGKTEVQRILASSWHIAPFDDKRPLREMAKLAYGFSEHQVSSPQGKDEIVDIDGRIDKVRGHMARLGAALEDIHGSTFFAKMALRDMDNGGWDRHGRPKMLSFGSVRMDQPSVYKARGAIIIEIRRPFTVLGSVYDRHDRSMVDIVIENDGSSLDALKSELQIKLEDYLILDVA